MKAWLETALAVARENIDEKAEGYLLGRGMQEHVIREMGVGVWEPPEEHAPGITFRERYGENGWKLRGRLVVPMYSPRGKVIGAEFRSMSEKSAVRHLLADAAWNPVFIGMKMAMPKIWAGGNVWLVEGLFDMTAMLRIVPLGDAVLATVRAKVADKHVEYLRRFCNGMVYVVYDNDETGRKQTVGWTDAKTGKFRWGALQRLERVDLQVHDARYRGGKDPGEIWENTGTSGLHQAFAHIL